MFSLRGIISDRIRGVAGRKIDAPINYERRTEVPKASSIRRGKGQGLGKGATRARSGKEE